MADNMDTNTAAETTGNTGSQQETQTSQESNTSKSFTQEEVDRVVASRIARIQDKYKNVDLDKYNEFIQREEQQKNEQLIKREKFDEVLNTTRTKYEEEIGTLKGELRTVRVDGALLNAASKLKAVNPEHVAQLLKANVDLNDQLKPIVKDADGSEKFNDKGEPYTIDQLVEEFLAGNPYFRSAPPAGAGSSTNTENNGGAPLDIDQLDMTNPEHRRKYEQAKLKHKLQ